MASHVDYRGFQAALFTALAWGFTGVFIKLLAGFSPFLVTAGRLLVSLVLVAPVVALAPGRRSATLAAARNGQAWWLGLFGVAYYGLAVVAYSLAPVGEIALMLSTTPLFVMAANLFLGVRPTRHEVAGAFMATAGIALVILPGVLPLSGFSAPRLFGHLLGLASSASAGLSALLFRRLSEERRAPDSFAVALLTFVIGSALLSALAYAAPTHGPVEWPIGADFGVLVALGVFCTLLPTITYAVASQRLPAVLNATIRLLIPVFAAGAAALILGERPSWWVLPGGALVIGGILIMVRPPTTTAAAVAEALGD